MAILPEHQADSSMAGKAEGHSKIAGRFPSEWPLSGTHFAHRPRYDIAKLVVTRPGLADAGSVAAFSVSTVIYLDVRTPFTFYQCTGAPAVTLDGTDRIRWKSLFQLRDGQFLPDTNASGSPEKGRREPSGDAMPVS